MSEMIERQQLLYVASHGLWAAYVHIYKKAVKHPPSLVESRIILLLRN